MKLTKLFKKVEDFFDLDENERIKKTDKMDKLISNVSQKIEDKKEKLQNSSSEHKKDKIKKELEVLKKFQDKLKIEQENQIEESKEDV